jgi:hypothetical protein
VLALLLRSSWVTQSDKWTCQHMSLGTSSVLPGQQCCGRAVAVVVAAGNSDKPACGPSPASAAQCLPQWVRQIKRQGLAPAQYGSCVTFRRRWHRYDKGRYRTSAGVAAASPHVRSLPLLSRDWSHHHALTSDACRRNAVLS